VREHRQRIEIRPDPLHLLPPQPGKHSMRIFFANLATETNTFSPIPTGRAAFMDVGYFRRDASRNPANHGSVAQVEWRRLAEAEGHEVVESVSAFAQPAGTTLRDVYEELRDDILADLRAALPVDVVLMKMHGAMVAAGYEDCEGDTLRRIRDIVGPHVVVGCELDLHCHLTEEMRTAADVIITYKEYPHIDVAARARELYALCLAAKRGAVKPVMVYHDCRMISMWRTTVEPMQGFVKRMQALEGQDGILSVSFGHGFPWGDVPEVGAKVIVVADGDIANAERLAAELGEELWRTREQCFPRHDSIDGAIDAALAAPFGPVVLADVADNAGGGAPSDNTDILRRLVDRAVSGVATGCYWDPVAVKFCIEAGIGASFDLRIGGKCGPASGQPVDLHVTVRGLARDHTQAGLSGGRAMLGDSVWVNAGGIDLILNSIRGQVFNQDAFTGLGCMLTDKRIVVVKSTQHFYAGFAPLGPVRYVAAGGAIGPDFASIPFTRRTRPYWPRVADPFATNN
jgi:microcystin degradation protein MlrC